MITKLSYYPMTCHLDDIQKAQERTRSIYAYSDTQVFGQYPAFQVDYYKNNNINIKKESGDD